MDKTGRKGIRAGQMLNVEDFADSLYKMIEEANITLARQGGVTLDPKTVTTDYIDAAARLRPYIKDTTVYLNKRLQEGAVILCEGAQGTLLDIDHGDYPFVTSSSPTAGGALTGLGIGPRQIDRVMGVAKCFSTRVGSGPMPTELQGELGNRLRGTGENHWDEYGTTTGRPRRCGWLDAVVLRYAAAVNGFTELFLTKLDVLSGFDELKIAVAYHINGQQYEFPPVTMSELEQAEVEYITLAGWQEDISKVRDVNQLPAATRAYVAKVAELCGTTISTISVGPERDQLVFF
jgi:adenylosuccinate synthase